MVTTEYGTGPLRMLLGEVRRGGHTEYWVHQVRFGSSGVGHPVLEGIAGSEFATSIGSTNATSREVVRSEDGSVVLRLSGRTGAWEASEEIELSAASGVFRREQTYRFLQACEAAVHPGFRLAAEGVRYTLAVKVHDEPAAALADPLRAAVDHGLPLPFHVWRTESHVAVYGLDKSVSPGTLDFLPADHDGMVTLRVFYPDSCPQTVVAGSLGRDTAAANPVTTRFAAGATLTLTEVVAAKRLEPGDDALLEADRIAASVLLVSPPRLDDVEAAADGIAGFYERGELWDPHALGRGRGWFGNMVVRTCTGSGAGLRFDGTGPRPADGGIGYDLGWGEGFGVYAWTGIVRHWQRTGDTSLLKYVDEMTANMELFRRGSGPDEPYFDTCRDGRFRANCGGRIVWTYALGRIGYELIGLHQSTPDYPDSGTRTRWLDAAARIARFFARHQREDGDLQDTFDEHDRATGPAFLFETPSRRCSARAIVCGLWARLGRATSDPRWTERAIRLAGVVVPEVRRYEFYNAHMDHGCPDAEAPAHVLAGLLPVYQATGDAEVLAACKAAAAYAISWTYLYDVPVPKTHNGVARGGQCCCACEPIIFAIGPGVGVEPLLAMSQVTGDRLYERIAAEMVSYIAASRIEAPGRPWHGGLIHAFLMYCGRSHGPDAEGQVDTGMATGAGLCALEAWMAHERGAQRPGPSPLS